MENASATDGPANAIDWYQKAYGDAAPTNAQWQRLQAWPDNTPVQIVNFFKFREKANYTPSAAEETIVTGAEAFGRYSAVSIPAVQQVGGEFLMVGPFAGAFAGAEQTWDLVAVAQYPNKQAVFDLFELEDYKAAYAHRCAACSAQSVTLVAG